MLDYRNRALRTALVMGALVLGASPSEAQTSINTTFQVTITIVAECVITSASTLDFGSQGVLDADVDATSTIQVQCTNTTPYNIGLDEGTFAGATWTTRRMSNAGTPINYSLFRNAGRTQNWGETIGTDTLAAIGNGAVQSHTVYGRVPIQTTPAPGVYTDTITVTVTY